MRMEYEEPKMDVVLLEAEDVVTASVTYETPLDTNVNTDPSSIAFS